MALILSIETSTTVCSVALHDKGKTIAFIEEKQPNSHAAVLTVLIEKLLLDQKTHIQDLDALAISSGPGSYTGLRIGVSVAKGICFALNKPLIAVSTLQIIAAHAKSLSTSSDNTMLICPMIDARRMEVYAALYTPDLEIFKPVEAEIITSDSYQTILKERAVFFCGNGSQKCQEIIQHRNAHFIPNIYAPAFIMGELAFEKYKIKDFEDVAYFEPFYLKNFVATTPKKSLF